MGIKNFALSLRQLDRWLAQEVGDPRAVRCRVAEAEFGYPIQRLLSPIQPGNAFGAVAGWQGLSPIEHFNVIVTHLAQIDHQQGARAALEPAMAVCRSVLSAANESTGKEHDQCLALGARAAELVGWLYQDSGLADEAGQWTVQALDLAEAANARSLVPYILMRRSAIAADLGYSSDALLLGERALQASTGNVERALALREIGAAYALKRDQPALRQSVDAALQELSNGAAQEPMAPYCSIPYIRSEAGAAALTLGDDALAGDYLSSAAAGWPDQQPRDRAICLARLAVAHAGMGQLEQAETVAVEASRAAVGCGSSRFTRTLLSAVDIVTEKGGVRRGERLTEQLSSLA